MIDILERDGDRVLWRHSIFDGESWIVYGRVFHTEVCDSDFMLTNPHRRKITRAVRDWLEETGEGEKWIEENSKRSQPMSQSTLNQVPEASSPIDPKLAWRIRSDRGLLLPSGGSYTNLRLSQIARLQAHFMARFKSLDEELKEMAEK